MKLLKLRETWDRSPESGRVSPRISWKGLDEQCLDE